MCGIYGIVERDFRGSEDLRSITERMWGALRHRGPDDWGIVSLDKRFRVERALGRGDEVHPRGDMAGDVTVVLGHHRLAIIDLSAGGHQPMSTDDGVVWITFNGEIYNYRELRTELEQRGVTFQTASDTEVLLELFAREGAAAMNRLRGMFAFAVWNEHERSLILARDRFGIKPLYYAFDGRRLLFASELGALIQSGCVPPERDPDAEAAFLSRGSIPAPLTWYRHAKALPPGHWLEWSNDRCVVQPYWSAGDALSSGPEDAQPASEVAPAIGDAFVDSVRAHMISDVPVGVFLSGGIDSAAIVGALRQIDAGRIRTFTIAVPGHSFDESSAAARTAKHFGTEHTSVDISDEELAGQLDRFFLSMDQPTADGLNTFLIGHAARAAGMKVVLSGIGGDECLGGYPSFVKVPRIYRRLRRVAALRAIGMTGAAAALAERIPARWAAKAAEIVRDPAPSIESVWLNYRCLFTSSEIAQLLPSAPRAKTRAPSPEAAASDPLWRIVRLEIERFMSPQLLRDADVFTMCYGLELRTPFVDHQFLAAVRAAGAWRRDRARTFKLALFRHLETLLPPNHHSNPKLGFTLPMDGWLRRALKAPSGFGRELQKSLNRPQYAPFIDSFLRGRTHWSRIWALYVLERTRTTTDLWTSLSSSSITTPHRSSRAV